MARPPRADGAAANVVARFSPDELAAARRLASARKLTVSGLLRALVAEEHARRKRKPPTDKDP
jgi:hypothetical protein